MPRRALSRSVAILGIVGSLAACGGHGNGLPEPTRTPAGQRTSAATAAPTGGAPTPTVTPRADVRAVARRVHANELGLVPVLMYHQLVRHPRSVYDESPADFRAELELLAREHYVPITAADFVAGRIDIPAGTHPVVLTFDDGTLSQFALDGRGRPRQGTAVAILEAVARRHPGFTATATFYVNRSPFVDPDGRRTLGWLHDHGFDIGDHTYDHANLSALSDAAVQRDIARDLTLIRRAVPGFTPTTMALPLGIYPRHHVLARRGHAAGTAYDFGGVFLVGSNPSHAPFHRDFDPGAVPRIRSESTRRASAADRHFVSGFYLPWLQRHPRDRYTSDGNPQVISFPRSFRSVLAKRFAGRAAPY